MRKVTPQALAKTPYPLPDVVTKVVPVPTEGWDAISPLASMDPKRAPVLTNWIPRPGYVELRPGYTNWVWLGDDNPVETLIVYRSSTTEKLFAAMGTKIYDTSILATATVVQSGLSSARWQYINFTPSGAATVIQCVNGVDQLRMYNGTSWSTPSITGFPGGLTTAAIRNIASSKRRIWYVLGNGVGGPSTIAAYMPTDAITGAIAGYQDLGALWNKGGNLVAIGNWTVDGGSGPQDYVVFVSSRGQITIYAGTDPSNAVNWSLVGTFDMSPPISLRCLLRVGSDLGLVTQDGVLPISQALPFDPSADRSVAITARIQNAMAVAATQYQDNFGWQLISYPAQQLAILNVPTTENVEQVQFVMNALTGAWCKFTGWNANCFEIFNEDLYFGSNDGNVFLAYASGLDLNEPISADMQCAFNYFDDPGRLKRMTMVQPLMIASGPIIPTLAVDEDFQVSDAVAPLTILASGAQWDSATWDESTWPAGAGVQNPWLSTEAIGHALAIHMTVNVTTVTSSIENAQFDFAIFDTAHFDAGGIETSTVPTLQINAFNTIMELGGFV